MRAWKWIIAAWVVATAVCSAAAQTAYGPSIPTTDALSTGAELLSATGQNGLNPVALIDQAGSALPGAAQSGGISAAMSVMLVLTVVALVPSVMLMATSFMRILIVLGLLRQAMGTAGIPPSQVITALALFMTLMVMGPTLNRIWDEAVVPYQNGQITDYDQLWQAGSQPLRDFMFAQIEATENWSSLYMLLEYKGVDISDPARLSRADVDTPTLITAFMLSEMKVAFLMGFKVYLPFLVIDMVIASVLISMSMMMLPPVLISLPFKLLLFVLVDGWTLVVGGLLYSFSPDMLETATAMEQAVRPVLAGWAAEQQTVRMLV